MKKLLEILAVGLIILLAVTPSPIKAETIHGESIAEESLIRGMALTPKKIISTLRYLVKVNAIEEEIKAIKDPVLKKAAQAKLDAAQAKFGANIVIGTAIDVMADRMEKEGVFNSDGALGKHKVDKYVFKMALHTVKNMIQLDVGGQILDSIFTVHESWKETVEALKLLPSDEELPHGMEVPKTLRLLQKLAKATEWMKNIGPTAKPISHTNPQVINFSFQDGLQKFQMIFHPIVEPFIQAIKAPSDSSQLSQRTAQQQLTPVEVKFTQTFDGLFTQAADFPGSSEGNHSGTITSGTRVGEGSRPGNFAGSFGGRTIAEPGYTPATHNNTPFTGSSDGTVSARGFKEGPLKGTMTIRLPSATQTATLSGSITINTDGSLSMPSYSGPVKDNATGTKVGTLTGSLNQGPTR